jgi:hypothetical protein
LPVGRKAKDAFGLLHNVSLAEPRRRRQTQVEIFGRGDNPIELRLRRWRGGGRNLTRR